MKTKWSLNFPPDLTDRPVTWTLVKTYRLQINILRASIDLDVAGNLLILVEGAENDIAAALAYLEEVGIGVDPGDAQIAWDESTCVHCGACTALCPAEALRLDPETWMLSFSPEKCLACGHCVPACPVGALSDRMG